jgi:3-oxoacyl-[acyl-carrier-protein] synthase-3
MSIQTLITGTGSCIPSTVRSNETFLDHQFLNTDGTPFSGDNREIIKKFHAITGIEERRYASPSENASDMAVIAALAAIESAVIDKETLDYIVVAHNFGDVKIGSVQGDMLPSLASRVKNKLHISNPNCVAYDLLFGCPGWVQGVIQAEAYLKSGMAKKVLVIGTEALSRVTDPSDRDSMIYADGAGACVLESKTDRHGFGVLSHAAQTFAGEEVDYLFFGPSYNTNEDRRISYIKMHGRKIYEFALNNVPKAMKAALDKSGVSISEVKKIFLHQANEKMDEAIVKRFFRLYKMPVPKEVMPMCIHKLGNSSVATVPTLLDLVLKGKMEPHDVQKGDVILLASVGAGMNINAVVYRCT